MKYIILTSLNKAQLFSEVNKMLAKDEGWIPQGGVSINGDFHGITQFAQALVTDKDVKTPEYKKVGYDL